MTIENSGIGTTDGRQARSRRTRAAVAEAMLDCLEDGLLRPSAKQVAERAGVSSRAVFRHFENMEALFEEAAALQIERVMNELPPLATEGSLEQRIDSLVLYSIRRNEFSAPVRRATELMVPFSKAIRERQTWAHAAARRQVRKVFDEELKPLSESDRADQIAALRALLSYGYWDELRRHGNLSTPAAERVLRAAVEAVLRPS